MNRSLFKRFLAALLTICIAFSSCVIVLAADAKKDRKTVVKKEKFVVIGDSIATGYLLDDLKDSYSSLMAKALNLEEVNLAVDGYDSRDVLNLLKTDAAKKAIADSKFISLSVGGNNILKLVLKEAEGMKDFDESNISTVFTSEMMKKLLSGVERFKTEFPKIIEKIKEINPDAVIVVQTVYNPYMFMKTGMSMEPSTICNVVIGRINKVMKTHLEENPGSYVLSDVFAAFKVKAKPAFLNADYASFNFDPHPALDGHALIAETNLAAIDAATASDVAADAVKSDKNSKTPTDIETDEIMELLAKRAAEKFKEIVDADSKKKP